MPPEIEVLQRALSQLRSDIISSLTRLEGEIGALQYAVLNEAGDGITPERLQQLHQAARTDDALVRHRLEREIRPVEGID